jgi:hypothetical protein
MAGGGYKRPLFTSRALRPGGEGTVTPKQPASLKFGSVSGLPKLDGTKVPTKLPALKSGGKIDIGALKGPASTKDASGPTKIGKGVPTLATGGRIGPKIPKMPKIPGIKPVKF